MNRNQSASISEHSRRGRASKIGGWVFVVWMMFVCLNYLWIMLRPFFDH